MRKCMYVDACVFVQMQWYGGEMEEEEVRGKNN